MVFARDARAFETRQSTWTNEYRRKVRTLTGNIQLCLWLPSVLIPFHNPIWVQFLFHKLFRLLTPYWLIACGVWVAAVCIGWVGNNPHYAFVPLALLLLLGLLAMGGVGKALRSLVVQGALMQAAVIAATINGLRGRWDVWVK